MTDQLFIGVDGGGTQCRARIRDSQGVLVGEGLGGPANVRLDPKLVMDSVLTACRNAAQAGGLGAGSLDGAHAALALAGACLESACRALLREPHPFASVALETDAYAAWLGAHGGEDGAILILGTGSCGLAVIRGVQHYVGGWGAEISDEASGAAIGREAIRRMLWAFDGRAVHTPLSDELLGRFGGDAEQVVAFATTAKPGDYARFAPLVFEHASRGDPLGVALLEMAGADATRIIDRLASLGAPSVCLLGGMAGALRPWLPDRLNAVLTEPLGDAMEGALIMARSAGSTLQSAAE